MGGEGRTLMGSQPFSPKMVLSQSSIITVQCPPFLYAMPGEEVEPGVAKHVLMWHVDGLQTLTHYMGHLNHLHT